jgi:hypothetical protein
MQDYGLGCGTSTWALVAGEEIWTEGAGGRAAGAARVGGGGALDRDVADGHAGRSIARARRGALLRRIVLPDGPAARGAVTS